MKIFSFGSEFFGGQIDRIRSGFAEFGHINLSKNSEEFPDLIYSNDPANYDNALGCYNYFNRNGHKPKLIFNVLDCPPHLIDPNKYDLSRYTTINHGWPRDFDPLKLREKLLNADIVTCICSEVQWQLLHWCGIDSHVIYNPIKDVNYMGNMPIDRIVNKNGDFYEYIFIGRMNDVNKRNFIIRDTINILEKGSFGKLICVGSEWAGYGDYCNVISDEKLNQLLNSVNFLFLTSAFSSIGLPALEAVVCKTIPIVCSDDIALKEFLEPIMLSPNPSKIAAAIRDKEWVNFAQNWVNLKSNEFKERFSPKQIAKNILNLI